MHVDVMQRHLELRKDIQGRFLHAPIEVVFPVGDEIADIGDAAAEGPWLAGSGIRKARQTEPGFQISDRGVGNVEGEWLWRHERSSLGVVTTLKAGHLCAGYSLCHVFSIATGS